MAKVTGAERDKRRAKIVKAYQKKSIREIAQETGYSYGHIHNLLSEANVQMRSRGGARR